MRKWLNYIPSIVVAGLILYLSLLRQLHVELPKLAIPHVDKLVHCLMYCCFAAVLTSDLKRGNEIKNNKWIALVSILVPIVYGGIIEILQEQFFYPRTGEWLDWVADIIGTILGFGITFFLIKSCKQKTN